MRMAECITLLCLVATSFAWAEDIDLPREIPDEPFDLQAARLEYTNQTIYASGGVTGTFENIVIRADELTANPDTGELHINGNVIFERGNAVWQGSKLDYNFIEQSGEFGPSVLYFDPVNLSVDHVERVSTNEYLLRGATFTTCPRENPHIRAKAREALLVDEKYVTAKGVTFYIGKVPVLHVPYWRHKLREGIFSYRLGYSSEWGPFALTKATVPVTRNLDSVTDVNLYGTRGVGLGQGFDWDFKKASGGITGFYLKDEDPYKRYDSPEDRALIDNDRYRFKIEHLQYFDDTHYVNTKWNYLSDPAVLEEFFKSEFRRHAQPENYGSWVAGDSYGASELFGSKRLNDFYENTDRVEYSSDLYRTRIGTLPVYVQSENSISHLERVFAETNTLDDAYDTVRIDSDNTFYLPQRYGFLRVVPRGSYRATYYSKGTVDTDEYRGIGGGGVEVSFQANRILSERERWYGRGMRHKVEPYADYIFEESSIATNRLRQFDAVDMLGDENKVKVGLRNVLQTRRAGRTARFIDLDLYTHYLVDRNGAPENFDSLFIDARMPLTRRTMVDLDGKYDWYDGQIDFFNTRISYDADDVIFSFEHLFFRDDISLWTPRVELFPEADLSFESYARYEDRSNEIEEVAVIGQMNWCCMRYGLGYHFYDDGEHRIMLSIGLSAFPEARISSGL